MERIAVGGMAEVYTAKTFGAEGFEKLIAIKRILPGIENDEDFIKMFVDEAKITGSLHHANIVPIYELGKISGSHFISMEYVWGRNLLEIINRFRKTRKTMSPIMAAWIASKMADALDYAHKKKDAEGRPLNIIHRDISPQNCIVSFEGQVKILDFGIAKAASRSTRTEANVLKGKFGYMSPEQATGQTIDQRTDIFAAGVVLWEMLALERLFLGDNDLVTLDRIRTGQVTPIASKRSDVPQELEAILNKALAKDMSERYPNAGAMADDLHRFIAMQKPMFNSQKLQEWMKLGFASEYETEKKKHDAMLTRSGIESKQKANNDAQDDIWGDDESTAISPPVFEQNTVPPEYSREEIEIYFTQDETLSGLPKENFSKPTASILNARHQLNATKSGGIELTDKVQFNAPESDTHATPLANAHPPQAMVRASQSTPKKPERSALEKPRLDAKPQGSLLKPSQALSKPASSKQLTKPPAPSPQQIQQPPQAIVPTPTHGFDGRSQETPVALDIEMFEVNSNHGSVSNSNVYLGDAQSKQRSNPALDQNIPFERAPSFEEAPTTYKSAIPDADALSADIAPLHSASSKWIWLGSALGLISVIGLLWFMFSGPANEATEPPTLPSPPSAPNYSGQLDLILKPDNATFTIDGEAFNNKLIRLKTGDHTLVAKAPGYQQEESIFTIIGNQTLSLSINLVADEAAEQSVAQARQRSNGSSRTGERETSTRETATGTLTIQTIPWARVFIDGKDTRKNTPLRSFKIKAGNHTIGLKTSDGQMHRVPVTIRAGQETKINRNL